MALAKCHKICFPDSLSDKLGLKYIAKTFHWFLNDNNKFLYHFQNANGEIVGYCGGFVSQGIGDGSSSGMLQHAFKEAVIGMVKKPWLIFNKEVVAAYPFILKNIKRKIFPGSYSKSFVRYSKDEPKYAGLVVIAVHPAYRGKGIFEELMKQFFIEANQKGAIGGSLSVRKDNERGIGAYKKNNWKIVKEDKHTFVMQKMVHH
jgi:ribosomal protein S18 acetylase RimI-like enzyme